MHVEKLMGTAADGFLLVGAFLLALEAFGREAGIKQVGQAFQALTKDPTQWADIEFVVRGVKLRSTDRDLKDKLERINARSNKLALWAGMVLTGIGILLDLWSKWLT
jgi:hypothetical protein